MTMLVAVDFANPMRVCAVNPCPCQFDARRRRACGRHHVRVDFVSMTVALVDVRNLAVERGADAFLRLEDCSSAAETHRAEAMCDGPSA